MCKVLLTLALAGLSATALAERTLIDTSTLPSMQVSTWPN